MHTQVSAGVELITPAIARELLRQNSINRPMLDNWVDTLAGMMARDEFKLNGETIKVAADGRLLDGQNRLTAIAKSGKPQELVVVRGLSPEVFDSIDQGKKRTMAHVFAIKGEKNAAVVASATRGVLAIMSGGQFPLSFTPAQQMQVLVDYPNLRGLASDYAGCKAKALAPSSLVSVLAIAAKYHGINEPKSFLLQVASGAGLNATNPALLLRERLIQSRTRRTLRLTADVAAALIIRAWNAHITSRPIRILKYAPGTDDFPAVQ